MFHIDNMTIRYVGDQTTIHRSYAIRNTCHGYSGTYIGSTFYTFHIYCNTNNKFSLMWIRSNGILPAGFRFCIMNFIWNLFFPYFWFGFRFRCVGKIWHIPLIDIFQWHGGDFSSLVLCVFVCLIHQTKHGFKHNFSSAFGTKSQHRRGHIIYTNLLMFQCISCSISLYLGSPTPSMLYGST